MIYGNIPRRIRTGDWRSFGRPVGTVLPILFAGGVAWSVMARPKAVLQSADLINTATTGEQ